MRGDSGASKLDDFGVHELPRPEASAPATGEIVPLEISETTPANDTGEKPVSPATLADMSYGAPIGGWVKRSFDICFASGALILLAPLLLAIAVAIRVDSPGRAIFKQERGGFGGRKFKIWKFRTMMVEEDGSGVRQAERDDERVTRLGRFLRRTSLDEFPQLVNVLIGDMSLVGPRPHAVAHDEQFVTVDPRYVLRTRARPGMTGLAQVFGCRGPTKTSEAIRRRTGWDVDYVQHWSLAHDIKILARTVRVMLHDPHAF
jgi:putative colanic acid biosynthesis UDP-glucose lipid carrier transferase